MSLSSKAEAMQSIAIAAQDVMRLSSSSQLHITIPSAYMCSELPPSDSLVLPFPQSITPNLIAVGLGLTAAQRFSSVFTKTALQLKSGLETQYRRTCDSCLRSSCGPENPRLYLALRTVYTSRYTTKLKIWTEQISSQVRSRVMEIRQGVRPSNELGECKRARSTFNYSAVPTLEQFFERNAFPRRCEKEDLAAKSGMEYRQINVWFQNRRNRFKKDGKELNRGSAFEFMPRELGTSLAELLSDDDLAIATVSSEKLSYSNNVQSCRPNSDAKFNLEAALHAFPSPYPPACSYDPFPIQYGERHFTVPWLRTVSSTRKHDADNVDVAILSAQFTKMAITENESRCKHQVRRSSAQVRGAFSVPPVASIGFATTLPRAPLSSLLHNTIAPPSSSIAAPNPHTFSRASFRYVEPPSSKSFASEPSVPVVRTKRAVSKRKITGLPRRLPTNASTAHSGMPSVSSASTSSSHSSLSPIASSGNVDPYFRTQPYYYPARPSSRSRVLALDPTSSSDAVHTYSQPSSLYPPTRATRSYPSPAAPVASSSKLDHHHPSGSLLQPTNSLSRKTASLPKRASKQSPSYHIPYTFHASSSRSVSTLSRMSSISSISSHHSTSSSSEDDSPLRTPPLLPTHLSSPKLGPELDVLDESYLNRLSPMDSLPLYFLSDADASHMMNSKEPALAFSGYPESSVFGYSIPLMA